MKITANKKTVEIVGCLVKYGKEITEHASQKLAVKYALCLTCKHNL